MAQENKYRNGVITAMTETLEEELGRENANVMSEDIQNAYAHLRLNLMELGLHDGSQEQGDAMEDRIRNITLMGREYLERIARENAEKPSDDWERLFATALGIPQDVSEPQLMEALLEKLDEIRQEANDLQNELDRVVELLVENLEFPVGQASKKTLEEVAQLKRKLDVANTRAKLIIDEAASKLPTDADRKEALAFVYFM